MRIENMEEALSSIKMVTGMMATGSMACPKVREE